MGGGAGGWGVREGKGVWGRGCCGGEGGVAVGVEIEGLLFQFTAVGWRLKAYFSSSQQSFFVSLLLILGTAVRAEDGGKSCAELDK